MAATKTLEEAIRRTNKQLTKQRSKAKHSKYLSNRERARSEIERLEVKLLNLENQIKFNNAINGS